MNKIILLIVAVVVSQLIVYSQPCFPDGLYIDNQSIINQFNELYPNCTEIIGFLQIYGSNITSLNGLAQINSVGGDLEVSNTFTTNLAGLSLNSVGGSVRVLCNMNLTSLSGLNVGSIEGAHLVIMANSHLTSLTSFNSLGTIANFSIAIENNPDLISLNGFQNLHTVNGYLSLDGDNTLASLAGFNNLSLVGSLIIGSEEHGGNTSLTSLNGLNNLHTINSNFKIYGNCLLEDLVGLDNLTYIGGDLQIENNNSLVNLAGLESLNIVGNDLIIGGEINYGNSSLQNLSGLHNVSAINGILKIGYNSMLTNIDGLNNISPISINNLVIKDNAMLSQCDIMNICYYLITLNGTNTIYNNAPGCNSPEEVEAACLTVIEEMNTGNGVTIIPNPSNNKITISSLGILGNTQLSIYNVSGEKVIERQLTDNGNQIEISTLPRGVYFVKVWDEKRVKVGKMVKE